MILFKSFFRKPKIQIYLIIFTILLLVLIALKSYLSYFDNYMQEAFNLNGFIEIKSNEDLTKQLDGTKGIKTVKKGIILDFPECYKVTNCEVNHYFLNQFAIVLPYLDSSNKNSLTDGEIIVPYFTFDENPILDNSKVGEKIQLFDSFHQSYDFKITSYIGSTNYNYFISKNDFEKLSKKSDSFYYKIFVQNYKKIWEMETNLKQDFKGQYDTLEVQQMNIPPINNTYQMIEIISVIFFILFGIILLISLRSLSKDLIPINLIEQKLGYSKLKIYLINFILIFTMLFISFILAYFLNFFIMIEMKSFIPEIVNIKFLDGIQFLLMLLIMTIVSSLFIFKKQ